MAGRTNPGHVVATRSSDRPSIRSCGHGSRRPAGRVLFAGEHTSERWQGYMNGAIESGKRAARRSARAGRESVTAADQLSERRTTNHELRTRTYGSARGPHRFWQPRRGRPRYRDPARRASIDTPKPRPEELRRQFGRCRLQFCGVGFRDRLVVDQAVLVRDAEAVEERRHHRPLPLEVVADQRTRGNGIRDDRQAQRDIWCVSRVQGRARSWSGTSCAKRWRRPPRFAGRSTARPPRRARRR